MQGTQRLPRRRSERCSSVGRGWEDPGPVMRCRGQCSLPTSPAYLTTIWLPEPTTTPTTTCCITYPPAEPPQQPTSHHPNTAHRTLNPGKWWAIWPGQGSGVYLVAISGRKVWVLVRRDRLAQCEEGLVVALASWERRQHSLPATPLNTTFTPHTTSPIHSLVYFDVTLGLR